MTGSSTDHRAGECNPGGMERQRGSKGRAPAPGAPLVARREVLKSAVGAAAGAAWLSVGASGTRAQEAAGKPVRIGIVGVGRRAGSHMAVIKDLADRCRITALCDIVPEKLKAGVERAGGGQIETFGNHMDLVVSGRCDAVVVTTPNYVHKQIAVDAMRGGLHVLCEKPMATTLADAREMVETVRETRRVFAVGLQLRFAPVYLKVRELLKADAIGDLKYVWADEFRGDWARLYEDPEVNARKNWRYFQRLSGGTLVEKNCHDFDILGWLIDANPTRVTGTGGTSVFGARETLDHATVAVDYEGGGKLTLGVCMFSPVHKADTTLVGTKGIIEFPRAGKYVTVRRPGKKDERFDLAEGGDETGKDYCTHALHVDWLDAIAAGRPPLTDVQVGYASLRVPVAAEQAIRRHEVIEMATFDG